jgi:amino acid adenylation domain-containing protein
MVAAMLGILKTGAAYVPLDPDYPHDRLAYMIKDSGLKRIIIHESLFNGMKDFAADIKLITIESCIISPTQELPANYINPTSSNIAYIIYTSGSTGKPKGVRIQHKSVVNFIKSMQIKPGINKNDNIMAITTLSFDISVLEILLPLALGASCTIVESDFAKNGKKLLEIIENSKITIMQATPGTWRLLLENGWKGTPTLKALCGGEALPDDLHRELTSKVMELWNMYGPTETTVWATCCQIKEYSKPVSIGYPIANTTTYILDSFLQPLPVGVPGQLYIGGEGLAESYHNMPELTSEKFITNPLSGKKFYATGDQARYLTNGAIEFLGRIDSQVKIRGFRIELSEIETVALNHPVIKECAVISKEFAYNDVRCIIYYTVKTKNTYTASDFRHHLKTFLPDYMIPQHFIELQSMPLTPSGKIDKKLLVSQFEKASSNKQVKTEPVTQQEVYLASVWKNILGINSISKTDNFFELGGHSLLSIKVISQIRNETGIEIHPRSMMLNSLEQIAANHSFNNLSQSKTIEKTTSYFHNKINQFFKRKKIPAKF